MLSFAGNAYEYFCDFYRGTSGEDYKDVNAFVDYDYPINNLNSWNRIRIQGDGQRAAKDYYLVIHLLELQGQFFANNLYVTCNKNFKIHFNLNELYVFLIKF